MRRSLLLVLMSALSACESGTARSVKLTVSPDTAARFSDGARGVVVADLDGRAAPWVVLCGQPLENPLYLSQDLGFGCLGKRDGTQETIRVWIEPVSVDAGTACSTQSSFYRALSMAGPDGGSLLAAQPDASWAQGSASGTWRRDLSPCGGVLSVTVSL